MEVRGTIRIPTREYAYIELEVNGTMEQIIDAYFEANQYYFRKQNRTLEEEVPFGANPNFNEGTEGKKQAFKPLR